MKRIGFYGAMILLQVLILFFPNSYSWENVGGLALFTVAYCFNSWLTYCSNKVEVDTNRRLEILERETREMNSAMQWREK